MMSGMGWGVHWLWWPLMAILVVFPFWRICQRLGYPGVLSVLILIPLVNLGLLYFLAFNEPADRHTI